MNAPEPTPSVFLNDAQIVDEIVRLISQDSVTYLRSRIVQDGVYEKTYADNFTLLRERFDHIGFQPRDSNVKKAFQSFRRSFIALDDMLIGQFGYEPRRKLFTVHPSRKEELREVLRPVYKKFESAYSRLLKRAINANKSNVDRDVSPSRVKIFINARKGIYIDKRRHYPISGKRFECVRRFFETGFQTSEDLKAWWPTSAQRTNEIRDINKVARRSLKLKEDIIVYSETAEHYHLNADVFDFSAE